ncbi:NAD(P)-dependent oxidoreductase [Cetobacterium somerae]|uniref:NAD(P)H-binding protein n=1 Tax=Cetobacterium somerae TaxID=188913 RepID=UPI00211DADCA|nr:NAD(P)H-binding protein [Cetobacterium somerae]MCQ9628117.1 NAD(P)-dependent oxidoreductase [Cetobacterium somerae]
MKSLIGYTGFVGSNLDLQINFDKKYNSKNISEIRGEEFEELYCAGVSAVKWFANQNPDKDILGINNLIENLKEVKVKRFILISTIDIYDKLGEVNEDSVPDVENQDTYGKNRYFLENWVKENFEDYLIVRLPALFGDGLKKNFIYDLINPIPSSIVLKKWIELKENLTKENFSKLEAVYFKDENNNYNFNKKIDLKTKQDVEEILRDYGFTSLSFTDSRSYFPFYYLNNLEKDINIALKNNVKTLNLSVEPLTCKELAKEVFNLEVNNCIENREPVKYDMKSKFYNLYNGANGYLYNKKETINFLKEFVQKELKSETSNI